MLFAMLAACADPSLAPPEEQDLVCDLDSYTVPDLSGVVYDADPLGQVVRVTDIAIVNDPNPPEDSIELRLDHGVPVFLRAADNTVAMRADTAFPVVGDFLNAWHTRVRAGDALPRYTATRLELFRDATGAPPTPPCDLESYAIPDLIGVVDWVGPVQSRGNMWVLLRDAVDPSGGLVDDRVVIAMWPGAYSFSLLRASDSTLHLADSPIPAIGETVQAWHYNLFIRTEPQKAYASRAEIFRNPE